MGAQSTSNNKVRMEKHVSPEAYKYAPPNVRTALTQRHCELPQPSQMEGLRTNVVSGAFAVRGQTDWAALCILPDGSARALIFWGKSGPQPCASEIHHGWALTNEGSSELPRQHSLVTQRAKQLLIYRKYFGDSNANPVDHDGLEVNLQIGNEDSSLIYYCYQGKWLELQGND